MTKGRVRVGMLAALVVAALMWPITAGRLPAAHAATTEAYHGVSSATHQSNFDRLAGGGYRMTSLSMSGTAAAPRYSAVWVQRSGPAFVAIHGATFEAFDKWRLEQQSKGFHLRLVAAVGNTNATATFGGYAEAGNEKTYLTTAKSPSQLASHLRGNFKTHMPISLAAYGTQTAPLFAAVLVFNGSNVWSSGAGKLPWNYSIDLGSADFQAQFNAQTGNGVRPALIVQAANYRFTVIWHDTQVNAWSARIGMPGADYQTALNDAKARGAYPIHLSAVGSGTNERFSAVFAPSDTIIPRALTMVPSRGAAEMAPFDNYMVNVMKSLSARAGQLAVARGGKLIYARAFTWAESGYPVTSQTTRFRVGSCSKTITSIAMHQTVQDDRGGLKHSMKIASLLGVKQQSGAAPADARWNDITLDHLLGHAGGWDQDIVGDFNGQDADVAKKTNNGQLPVDQAMITRYAASVPLNFAPGTKSKYSNFGYSLLGQAVGKIGTGKYETTVQQKLMQPLGLSRPALGKSLIEQRTADEARYHSTAPAVSKSVMTTSQPWVVQQYGGINIASGEGAGAWAMAAPDYAKILAAFSRGDQNPIMTPQQTALMWASPIPNLDPKAVRGWYAQPLKNAVGGDITGYWHNGGLPGSACFVMHTTNGFDYVMLLNTDSTRFIGGSTDGVELNKIANSIRSWPTVDLFPSVGIPSF